MFCLHSLYQWSCLPRHLSTALLLNLMQTTTASIHQKYQQRRVFICRCHHSLFHRVDDVALLHRDGQRSCDSARGVWIQSNCHHWSRGKINLAKSASFFLFSFLSYNYLSVWRQNERENREHTQIKTSNLSPNRFSELEHRVCFPLYNSESLLVKTQVTWLSVVNNVIFHGVYPLCQKKQTHTIQ